MCHSLDGANSPIPPSECFRAHAGMLFERGRKIAEILEAEIQRNFSDRLLCAQHQFHRCGHHRVVGKSIGCLAKALFESALEMAPGQARRVRQLVDIEILPPMRGDIVEREALLGAGQPAGNRRLHRSANAETRQQVNDKLRGNGLGAGPEVMPFGADLAAKCRAETLHERIAERGLGAQARRL